MNQPHRMSLGFDELARQLERVFGSDGGGLADESAFETWAERAFELQYGENEVYRRFCAARGVTPHTLQGWRSVPAVPATAFKHIELRSVARPPEAVFRTSGTSAGPALRGRHYVPRLALYRAAALPPFRRHVMAELESAPFVSLVPRAVDAPHSSLSLMVDAAAGALASESHWLVDGDGTLDVDRLRAVASRCADRAEPVVVLGTALAFVHLLERLSGDRLPPLPEGSRVMETGGFKGLDRGVTRERLYRGLTDALGVPEEAVVNEYGMTELLSQLYEPVLTEGPQGRGRHVAPPWMRVQALDAETLEPMEEGRPGLLAFFDLANLGSVCHVLTQDVGTVVDGRVRLVGRIPGAEPRGCSRATDELLNAARPRR